MRFKQFLLSVAVVLTFVAYTWQQKHEGSGAKLVLPPASSSGTSSTQSSSAASGSQSNSSSSSTTETATYKDGSYTGSIADAYYGNVQVEATIASGKITDVQFLSYPNDRANSIYINQQAMPYLKQEALAAQSANVNIISGATLTSNAFVQSLSAALQKAQA